MPLLQNKEEKYRVCNHTLENPRIKRIWELLDPGDYITFKKCKECGEMFRLYK